MTLPLRQQWSLWRIEHALRQSDPGLVTLIANFTRFALDGELPDRERLTPRAAWGCRFLVSVILRTTLIAVRAGRHCRGAFARLGAGLMRLLAGTPAYDLAAPHGADRSG